MQTDWLIDQNKWYLLNSDGSMCAISGRWYMESGITSMEMVPWLIKKDVGLANRK